MCVIWFPQAYLDNCMNISTISQRKIDFNLFHTFKPLLVWSGSLTVRVDWNMQRTLKITKVYVPNALPPILPTFHYFHMHESNFQPFNHLGLCIVLYFWMIQKPCLKCKHFDKLQLISSSYLKKNKKKKTRVLYMRLVDKDTMGIVIPYYLHLPLCMIYWFWMCYCFSLELNLQGEKNQEKSW